MARASSSVSKVLFSLGLLLSTTGTASAGLENDRLGSTRMYLSSLEPLGFAGIVAISRNGIPVLVEGYGLADREGRIPWNPATVATIGSITKQFTAAAVLRLQEQGRLSVTDSIAKHFSGVPDDKRSITLQQLLTHSSGIVDLVGFDDFDPIDRTEFVERALEQPLAFEPGTGYEYSNAGYSLLGAVIEQTTGDSYEVYLRDNLLAPAGLFETGYLLPSWGRGRWAQGYTEDGKWGTLLEKPWAEDGPYWVLRANGGLHSTAFDMLRWAQALLAGRALTAASMEAYWTPRVDEGGGTFYAYGWVVDEIGGHRVITHNGGNGIFFADMAIVPDLDLVVFLQTNVANPLPMVETMLYSLLAHLVAKAPLPRVPRLAEIAAEEIDTLTGDYAVGASGHLTVARDRQTLVTTPRDPEAFAYLHSNRVVDLERSTHLSQRIDSIVGAYIAGDVEPLWQAYRREVPIERLTEIMSERMREAEDQHGAFERYEVLGTALRQTREVSLVRLHFADGFEDRAYVWEKDADHELLGVSRRGLADSVTFYPEGDGAFASWDPRTGESEPLRTERDQEGRLRLHIGEGDLEFTAVQR